MLRRAAFVAVTLAPALPGLAWAQATPDRAASLQQQIQGWLQTTVGSAATITSSPVHVTAAGDHYDLSVPLGFAPDAPNLTGKMTDAGNGRWAVDDVRLPSPGVFQFQLPASTKPGAPTGVITTTLTVGEQNQHMLLDPTFATPSTWTSAVKDLAATTTGQIMTQLSHIDSAIGASTMTPVSDGRVDLSVNSSLDGYTIKTSTQAPDKTPAPQDAKPLSIAMGKVTLVANVLGLSRERGLDLMHAVFKLGAAANAASAPGIPALDHETSMALLSALADLATGISVDEKVTDLSVSMQGLSGSLGLFAFGLTAKTDAGKLAAQMPLAAAGLTLPELGLGSTAKLIPTKLALTPNLSSVPTAALMQLTKKAADKQTPGADDVAALFAQGPITLGIDDFALDVAGSSFAGSIKVLASTPNTVSGTGQITAENIDRLQQAISADPQTAQGVPVLIFLKGIGRAEQNRMVWDMVYRDGHLIVNGQDMTALMTPPASPPPPRTLPTPPNRKP
jgi:hypothetical protein